MSDHPRPSAPQTAHPARHTAPAGPIEHGFDTSGGSQVPFARFGILLPVCMLSMIPALILLYVSKIIESRELFIGASALTLLLITGASILLVISGIIGAIELQRTRRLFPHHTKDTAHARRY